MGRQCQFLPRFPQVLPGLMFCNTLLAFLIAYVWSVELDYVYSFFPYISDAGGKQPVSCVFGQLLNISALIALMMTYLRYKLVTKADNSHTRLIRLWNKGSLLLAIISVLGLSMVANFQVETSLIQVHLIGAGMVFIGGTLYSAATCVITFFFRKQGIETTAVFIPRVVLTSATGLFLLSTFITASVAQYQWSHSPHSSNNTRYTWQPDDPGFDAHVISTFSEWLMGLMFLMFFLTYHGDFGKITSHVMVMSRENGPFGLGEDTNEGPVYA